MRRPDPVAAPGSAQVPRPDLDDALAAATRNLVCLVIGAAGWGKTTAVRSWAESTGADALWWAPSGSGRDAERLLGDLARAALPADADHAGDAAPVRDAAEACDRLGALRSTLHLVIDELHEVDEPTARTLAELCRLAPSGLHLVLLSRQDPPFSLERLRGRGKVTEIDAARLALAPSEIAELLRTALGAQPPGLADALHERTGGWPAAVCRAVQSLRAVPEPRAAEALPTDHFRPYLTEEVLDGEPEPARHALHRLAVLGEATAAESGDVLTDLARRGLLRPAGLGRWSLVPPLAEFFAESRAVTPEARTELHLQAAEEHRREGRLGQALRHLVTARDADGCAALLHESGPALLEAGHVDAVLDADALLGERADVSLARIGGQAHQIRGRWAEAARRWRHAGDPGEPGLAWRIAAGALARGEPHEALAACSAAAPVDGDPDTARVFAVAAVAHRLIGEIERGAEFAEQAVDVAQRSRGIPGAGQISAVAHGARAVLNAARGDHRGAVTAWFDATDNAPDGRLAQLHVVRALHLVEGGSPGEAVQHADKALRIAEQHGEPLLRAHALTQRGAALARLGRFDEAIVAHDEACDVFRRYGSRFLSWALCVRGDVHRQRGRLERARSAYEEALALAGPDLLGTSSALLGLARVRVVDDPDEALRSAQRAIGLGELLHEVRALLTRGWIWWETGATELARADAALAAERARARGDEPGLAEALALTAVTSPDPLEHGRALDEAVQIWREGGFGIEQAQGLLLRHRLGPARDGVPATVDLAERTLREHGIVPDSRAAAGPLAAVAHLAPPVALHALGVFQVEHAGRPVPKASWQSRKARDLLKILVAKRRPVRREELMELLWPEVEPVRAGNRLSVLLSTVRDVLASRGPAAGSVLLTSEAGTVGLDPRHVRIDVESFAAQAERALEAHRQDHDEVTELLLAAEAAYTGDFLEDDPYQDWAAPLADELRTTHTALLRALTRRLRDEGDADRVARFALRLLRDDPYDEEAHLDLVETLLRQERFGEARRRYEIYGERMREISVAPRPFPEVSGTRRPDHPSE